MGSIEESQLKMATKYILKQATTKQEVDAIIDVIWTANYTPYEPFAQIFFPVLGFLPSHREAAIAESKERFWNNHQSDPSSKWYYVEEVETGNAVGCAQWQVFVQNPFPNGPPQLRAPWWPEGEHRDFVELILNQVYKPRASWMTRPHLGMSLTSLNRIFSISLLLCCFCFTSPSIGAELWPCKISSFSSHPSTQSKSTSIRTDGSIQR